MTVVQSHRGGKCVTCSGLTNSREKDNCSLEVNRLRLTCNCNLVQLYPCSSTKTPVTHKRIHFIIEYLTYAVFLYTCRGLYETHKFLFTLLLALKIDLHKKKVNHTEFEVLVKGWYLYHLPPFRILGHFVHPTFACVFRKKMVNV